MTQAALTVERQRGAWWQATWKSEAVRRMAIFMLSLSCALLLWTLLAWWVGKPAFLPSPEKTLNGALELISSGDLQNHVFSSFTRIIIGFVIGTAIGIPLGLAMGSSQFVRAFVDPYVEFFRFIPPIAFVTLAVIWFGLGETSKIVLIVYTTLFMVAINTMIGVLGVEPDKRFAALCLGATRRQVFLHVTIPAVIPNIVDGHEDSHGQQLHDCGVRRDGCGEVGSRFSDLQFTALPADGMDFCRHHHPRIDGIHHRSRPANSGNDAAKPLRSQDLGERE